MQEVGARAKVMANRSDKKTLQKADDAEHAPNVEECV